MVFLDRVLAQPYFCIRFQKPKKMKRRIRIAAMMLVLWSVFTACPAQQSDMVHNKTDNRRIEKEIHWKSTILDFFCAMQVCLYSNPTRDSLTLAVRNKPDDLTLLFKLTTALGTVLQEKEFSCDRETFDISQLPPDVYLFQLIASDRKQVWKLVKE